MCIITTSEIFKAILLKIVFLHISFWSHNIGEDQKYTYKSSTWEPNPQKARFPERIKNVGFYYLNLIL